MIITKYDDQYVGDNVPVTRVSVDYSYARALTPARMRKLDLKTWDHRRAGVLYFSMRDDGVYYTIDGQGRMYLALRAGVQTVPGRVYLDLTHQEEAELYLAFNRDRAPTKPIEDYLARLAANDPVALGIQVVLDSLSMKIHLGAGNGYVRAIAPVEDIYVRCGPVALYDVLDTLAMADPHRRDGLTGQFIGGMGQFLARYSHLTPAQRKQLAAAMAKESHDTILSRARYVQRESPGMSMSDAVGRVLRSIYNKNHTRHQLPDWPARVYTKQNPPATPPTGAGADAN